MWYGMQGVGSGGKVGQRTISVNTFSNNEVCLFVLDELKTGTEVPDFLLNRCNLFVITHVKLAVDVESGSFRYEMRPSDQSTCP